MRFLQTISICRDGLKLQNFPMSDIDVPWSISISARMTSSWDVQLPVKFKWKVNSHLGEKAQNL